MSYRLSSIESWVRTRTRHFEFLALLLWEETCAQQWSRRMRINLKVNKQNTPSARWSATNQNLRTAMEWNSLPADDLFPEHYNFDLFKGRWIDNIQVCLLHHRPHVYFPLGEKEVKAHVFYNKKKWKKNSNSLMFLPFLRHNV